MKETFVFSVLAAALVLTGAGCISFSSSSTTGADGAIWKTQDSGASWDQLTTLPQASGVTSIGGVNIADLEIDPTDTSTYYLGTYGNGLFYSTNVGNSWARPAAASVGSGTILKIEVDPRDVCTLYLLTPSEVLKTTDCLRSVNSIYQIGQSDETLTAMVLDWYNSDILWVGDTTGALYQSLNAGGAWSAISRFGRGVTAILVNNRDSRIILAGTNGNSLFRSIDAGATWTEYEDTLKKQYRDTDDVYGFTQTADGTSIIMNSKYGLLLSEDFGENWTSIPLLTENRDVKIWAVAYDPESSLNIYYLTATTFYATTTAGISWETEDSPSSRTPTEIVVHPKDDSVIYAGFAAFSD